MGSWPEPLRTKALQGRGPAKPEQALTAQDRDNLAGASPQRRASLNRLLFPAPTREYTEHRARYGDTSVLASREFFYGLRQGEETRVTLSPGVTLHVGLEAITARATGTVFTRRHRPHRPRGRRRPPPDRHSFRNPPPRANRTNASAYQHDPQRVDWAALNSSPLAWRQQRGRGDCSVNGVSESVGDGYGERVGGAGLSAATSKMVCRLGGIQGCVTRYRHTSVPPARNESSDGPS